jgi:outer membrane protein TolC
MMAPLAWAWNQGIFAQMLITTADPPKKKPHIFRTFSSFPLILLGLGMLFVSLLGWPTTALSAEAASTTTTPGFSQAPVDFDSCVQLALRQSPFFTKSTLEIEVRRLDEADSKADFFPSFKVSTRYYISQPKNPFITDPLDYSFALSTGDYNPIFAYLSLKAKKVITRIATMAHLKVIATGLKRLGKAFLELEAAERLAHLQGSAANLAQEHLRYFRERQKLGEITPMEVQIASQEMELATAEQESLVASQGNIKEAIRDFLDLRPNQPLHLELSQARRQVLGDFDPAKASKEKAEERDFEVRVEKLKKELQSWNVTLAKMKFLPSVNFTVQTPDPLSQTNTRGTFFSVGLSFPLYEGFKRVRNINRQKTILKQFTSEVDVKASKFTQEWRKAEEDLRTAAAALRVAQAQDKLTHLKERQGETLYRSGEKDFSVFMAARQARVKAQMAAVKTALDYDLAVLEVRHLTGDLVSHYVKENQFQE